MYIYLKKIKMKQFDIHYFFNLFYFQSLIQLNLFFLKNQNKWIWSQCNILNILCKSKFDSFCVNYSVQLPHELDEHFVFLSHSL
jgi:hypothetical protein